MLVSWRVRSYNHGNQSKIGLPPILLVSGFIFGQILTVGEKGNHWVLSTVITETIEDEKVFNTIVALYSSI